ncbi:hypothetical protein SAMN05421504_10342 [Amycolatopsis xylanica]|uniref:DUF6801 domain-containing protein n=1 Tax=Amycolatopsis xylanica TaxID=589385 RepID=A0A1H3CJP2_9PSEU|nr:DUF6801 domain-containing protein [Amycolatopsis xylanica]SDX53814.1 hypothetical protein SAMN05421504_10342 [Amycolatopsis xylanica]
MPHPIRTKVFVVLATACLIGAVSSTGSASEPAPQTITKSLKHTCLFGEVPRPVAFEVTATLPTAVPKGQPVPIENFSLKFALPKEALPPETTSVEGGVSLDLTGKRKAIHSKETKLPVVLDIAATPVTSEELTLTATGKPGALAMTTSGRLIISFGAPELALNTKDAKDTKARVKCTLDADQDAALGSVAVIPPKSEEDTPATTPDGDEETQAPKAKADEPDPNVIVVPLDPLTVNGTSTIVKLGAKAPIGPSVVIAGHVLLDAVDPTAPLISEGEAVLPPVQVAFLGFGFMPVNATAEFLPVDYQINNLVPVKAVVTAEPDGLTYGRSHIEVYARLSNVKVNGAPLDVGTKCMSSTPISIDLYGPYDAFSGGVLKTDPNSPDPALRGFTIPSFAGCGAAEPLSPLFTGMSSGPMNQAEVTVALLFPKPE